MNQYLDTSSLIKLLIDEKESRQVEELVTNSSLICTSVVAWPELRGGLARAGRAGRITQSDRSEVLTYLGDLWARVQVVALDDAVASSAGDYAETYYLRGLDAIHLASALAFRDAIGQPLAFSTFDLRLAEAANACGLPRA